MLAFGRHRQQLEVVAVQPQRPVVTAIADDVEACADAGAFRVEIEVETNLRDQPVGRSIILAADRDMGW